MLAPSEEEVAVPQELRRTWRVGFLLAAFNLLDWWFSSSAGALLLAAGLLIVAALVYQGSLVAAAALTAASAFQTIVAFRFYLAEAHIGGLVLTVLWGIATWTCYRARERAETAGRRSPPDR